MQNLNKNLKNAHDMQKKKTNSTYDTYYNI